MEKSQMEIDLLNRGCQIDKLKRQVKEVDEERQIDRNSIDHYREQILSYREQQRQLVEKELKSDHQIKNQGNIIKSQREALDKLEEEIKNGCEFTKGVVDDMDTEAKILEARLQDRDDSIRSYEHMISASFHLHIDTENSRFTIKFLSDEIDGLVIKDTDLHKLDWSTWKGFIVPIPSKAIASLQDQAKAFEGDFGMETVRYSLLISPDRKIAIIYDWLD